MTAIPCRIPDLDIRRLHNLHQRGAMVSELGTAIRDRYGYASDQSARNALRLAFRRLGLPTRDRSDTRLMEEARLNGRWTQAMIDRMAALREVGLSPTAIAAVLTLDFPDVRVTRHSVQYRIEVLERRHELKQPQKIIGYARRALA